MQPRLQDHQLLSDFKRSETVILFFFYKLCKIEKGLVSELCCLALKNIGAREECHLMEHVNSKVMRNRLPHAMITAVSLFLVGCAFQLAGAVYPPPGKSNQEQQVDMLFCKDQAKKEATTVGRQAGWIALGLTIVGVPLAVGLEKQKQREAFAQCMTARGYRVDPVTDGTTDTTASQSQTAQPPAEHRESGMQGSSAEGTRE